MRSPKPKPLFSGGILVLANGLKRHWWCPRQIVKTMKILGWTAGLRLCSDFKP